MTDEFKRRSMQSLSVLLLLAMAGTLAAGDVQTLNPDTEISASRTAGITLMLNSM